MKTTPQSERQSIQTCLWLKTRIEERNVKIFWQFSIIFCDNVRLNFNKPIRNEINSMYKRISLNILTLA